jgi:hypothetical protein
MQAAIGQQLKIEYEPPRELTPELAIVLRKKSPGLPGWGFSFHIRHNDPFRLQLHLYFA